MALPVAAIIAIVSAIGSTYAAVEQGRAASKAARYNAALAEQEAEQERQRGRFEERRSRVRGKALLSAIQSGYGTAGVASEGTPLLVQAEQAGEIELEALLLRHGGETAALRSTSEARLQRFRGSQLRRESTIRAGTTLLTGAARAYDA